MWENHKDNINPFSSGTLLYELPVLSQPAPKNEYGIFSFSLVLSQACDINSYFTLMKNRKSKNQIDSEYNRQIIYQVMLCPLFELELFKSGNHLKLAYQIKTKIIEESKFSLIETNNDSRYMLLKSNIDQKIIKDFIIDFKQFFTLPIELVKSFAEKQDVKYNLEHIHFTNLSDKFSHYLQRVAIP